MVNPAADKLSNEDSVMFHHLTANLLYLAKRTRPDLQAAVSFLTMRVRTPDVDHWKNLGRYLDFLCDPHIFEGGGSGTVRWWVDASFAVHPVMKSHTGSTMHVTRQGVRVLGVMGTSSFKYHQFDRGEACWGGGRHGTGIMDTPVPRGTMVQSSG